MSYRMPQRRTAAVCRLTGGKTWRSATVTGSGGHYRAVYCAPADSYVMLRTAAADSAGDRIAETITRAYRTAS
ncbi:MAG TPA: hypothetical protein VGL63_03800 [Streptosporangiaceae bacterium]|jgi:hypothetical protein